jgi:peptide chain release factor 1
MLEKLEAIKKKWKEIEQKMNEPSAMANMKLFIKLNKDYKDLQPIVEGYDKLSLIVNNIESAKDVLNNEKDEEFRMKPLQMYNLFLYPVL